MSTNLTDETIKDTFGQLLHVDGGVTGTTKAVYDGDGTQTALKVSTTVVEAASIKIQNAILRELADGEMTLVNPKVRDGTVYPTQIGYDGGVDRTQLTSRATGVTANAVCGSITLVAGTIAAHTADEFTLTNSYIAAGDIVLVSIRSGLTAAATKHYTLQVTETGAGYCKIAIGNKSASTIPSAGSDTPRINFAVFKSYQSILVEP